MQKKFHLPKFNLEVEIGKFARQADGAVWIRCGNNIVLATAVISKDQKDFAGFLPLTVEYRERMSAAGKIPGGYIKREGKLSDSEVLTSRIIDRPIRPLFPHGFHNEVQILTTVYSSDGKFPTSIMALIGASLALTISKSSPFLGPIGAVQIGRVNGEWKFNLSFEDKQESDCEIIVASTQSGICMVEGSCNDIEENQLIDLLLQAHEINQEIIKWQLEIKSELAVEKSDSAQSIDWDSWISKIKEIVTPSAVQTLFAASKEERSASMSVIEETVKQHFASDIENEVVTSTILSSALDSIIKELVPNLMSEKGARLDGRRFDEVRPIYSEVETLPCSHGSSLFQRGETQALASLTLGSGQDAQKIDTLIGGVQERSFMLHYNFPPFSTGEVRPIRGTGRREIGHGYLAEKSFYNVLPSQEEFPYTIRSVVDVLESNGSSSMATVCSTTLALMDAGVPIRAMVSGIAMGLIRDSQGEFHVLTDILGVEDGFGLMDFKVTGTEKGIMGFQLDVKDKVGLPKEVLIRALEQARVARLHILDEMKKTLTTHKSSLSPFAPRITTIKIESDKIGTLIGPGGKMIKEIVAKTGAQIDIEDDGTVKIFSKDQESGDGALSWIKALVGDLEVGAEFNGTIRRFTEFGVFVEVAPGRDGLVHISTIAKNLQRDLERNYRVGDKLTVKVTAYDRETGRIRLVAPELDRQQQR